MLLCHPIVAGSRGRPLAAVAVACGPAPAHPARRTLGVRGRSACAEFDWRAARGAPAALLSNSATIGLVTNHEISRDPPEIYGTFPGPVGLVGDESKAGIFAVTSDAVGVRAFTCSMAVTSNGSASRMRKPGWVPGWASGRSHTPADA